MKKYVQITVVLGLFFLFVYIRQLKSGDDDTVVIGRPSPTSSSTPIPTSMSGEQNSSSGQGVITPTPTPLQRGQYKDGSYIGDATDAFYGNIQVQASIVNGRLADVTFLQYPNDNYTSLSINQQAMPLLRSEAIQVQGANVDIVSGASDSSTAFRGSLSSALQQAK